MNPTLDVYLLPQRDGGYFLHTGGLDPSVPDREEPDASVFRKAWRGARRAHAYATRRRRERELLLQSLGDLEKIRILYPSSWTEARARGVYEALVRDETARHGKWMLLDAAAVPIAVPLSLVPGPNLLLAYLAWRSATHYKLKKAGERAGEFSIDFAPSSVLSELEGEVRAWRFYRTKKRIRKLGEALGIDGLDRAY